MLKISGPQHLKPVLAGGSAGTKLWSYIRANIIETQVKQIEIRY